MRRDGCLESCPFPDGPHELACALSWARRERAQADFIDVIFDGPPGHKAGRFIEVEDPSGKSVRAGDWIDRGSGQWALRIPRPCPSEAPPHRRAPGHDYQPGVGWVNGQVGPSTEARMQASGSDSGGRSFPASSDGNHAPARGPEEAGILQRPNEAVTPRSLVAAVRAYVNEDDEDRVALWDAVISALEAAESQRTEPPVVSVRQIGGEQGPWRLFIGDRGVATWPSQAAAEDPEDYANEVARCIRDALGEPEACRESASPSWKAGLPLAQQVEQLESENKEWLAELVEARRQLAALRKVADAADEAVEQMDGG